jgi:hypothetical protein
VRLSDLRVCDGCGGPLFSPSSRWFQVVRTSGALLTAVAHEVVEAAARNHLPLDRLEHAVCGPAVMVLGDEQEQCLDELLLCVTCFHERPIAEIARRRRETLAVAQGRLS